MSIKPSHSNIHEGFIRLPRSLLDSENWNNLRIKQQKLFLYILQKAQYVPYIYKHNGKDIHLMPGELCISLRRLVDDFNETVKFKDEKIDVPFLQRAVSAFLKVGLTDTRTDTGITIISVIYPGIYDSNISKTDTPSDTLSIHFRYSHLKEEDKKDKKRDHPSIPSFENGELDRDEKMSDDFSSKGETEIYPGVFLDSVELETCVAIKGDAEKVREAIAFIQNSPRRKYPISDWAHALSTWKIGNNMQAKKEEHRIYAENLSREFTQFSQGSGWRCYLHNDREKDQTGLVFENESPYLEGCFIALVDGQFQDKCEDFIKNKNMRKK